MHFVEVCQYSYVHGQCKCPGPKEVHRVDCPTGQHGPEWLVWDEQQQRVRRQDERPPRNVALWLIGPDDAPEAIEIEQSDGQVYLLCKSARRTRPSWAMRWRRSRAPKACRCTSR